MLFTKPAKNLQVKRNNNIKLFFIRLENTKINSIASLNRFIMLHNMTSVNYDTEIVVTTPIKSYYYNFKILKALCIRLKLISAIANVASKINKKNTNIICIFGFDPAMWLIYRIVATIYKIKFICELNEYPKIKSKIDHENFISRILYLFYFRSFDGITIISDELRGFVKQYAKGSCVITKLPMTVEFKRFNNINTKGNSKYIFYAGSLNNRKDGILYLINAFMKIRNRFPDIELLIAGDINTIPKYERDDFKRSCTFSGITYLGQIERDKIPEYICKSSLCVLPRPDSRQAKCGFPTKLGEYLAAGKPTISTAVGEIPTYLNENEIFYISKDNIEVELIHKIVEVFENYDNALEKAKRGRIVAYKYFSTTRNTCKLNNFIKTVVNYKFSS